MLQREGAAPRTATFSGSAATQAQVKLLEAKVEALEEENRTLRQRELMRKMFALGDKAKADEEGANAKAAGGSVSSSAASAPGAPPKLGPNGLPPPRIEFTLLRGFTARELVTFDPFRGFDMAQAEGFGVIEEEEVAAKPRKGSGSKQKAESLTKQSTLSRISSFMGFSGSSKQITPS